MVLACQISAITAQDLLFGPTLRQFPDLKVALSEGGIGWIPFYFDRVDRHYENQAWLNHDDDFGGKLPSEVFREHILACYITDPSGLALRDRIGVDIIAWECDYPHTDTTWPESPEYSWKEFQDAGVRRRGDRQDHLAERVPVLRLGPVRAHAEGAGDASARSGRWPPTSTSRACRARSGASATRPPASASSRRRSGGDGGAGRRSGADQVRTSRRGLRCTTRAASSSRAGSAGSFGTPSSK